MNDTMYACGRWASTVYLNPGRDNDLKKMRTGPQFE